LVRFRPGVEEGERLAQEESAGALLLDEAFI
jgi:hypothetical protein